MSDSPPIGYMVGTFYRATGDGAVGEVVLSPLWAFRENGSVVPVPVRFPLVEGRLDAIVAAGAYRVTVRRGREALAGPVSVTVAAGQTTDLTPGVTT